MSSYFSNKVPSAKSKYHRRLLYKFFTYEGEFGQGGPEIKDFNAYEFQYYGTMDDENYSINPRINMLRDLPSRDPFNTHQALEPVVRAYNDLLMKYNNCIANGQLAKTGPFGDMKVIQAYTPPVGEYDKHMGNVLLRMNTMSNPDMMNSNNIITNYNDYVKRFFDIIYNEANYHATTMSGFMKSNKSNVLNSGLAIKFYDIDYDDDSTKVEELVNDHNFAFFRNLCLNFGFSISHNNPNIIVFDISSPVASRYFTRTNTKEILFSLFEKTYKKDILYLNNNIKLYYNKYVYLYPETTTTYVNCGKTFQSKITRRPLGILEDPPKYDEITAYTKIRNTEEGNKFSKAKIDNIIKKAKYLQKKFDKTRAMGYISNMFKDFVWQRPYGYDDFLESLKENPSLPKDRGITTKDSSSPSNGGGSGY